MNQEIVRVLIADDIPQVRKGLATMLQLASKNHVPMIEVVGEAQNGNDAVQQAQQLHPDVILMDLEMPFMNGYDATRRIKSISPSIYIIILTIHGDPATRQKAADAGADAFIEKSAPPDGLIRALCGFRMENLDKELL